LSAGVAGCIALILLAGLCTYWNSLGVPFLWDDETAIVTNQTIRELWPLSGPLLPPLETPVAARPLVNVSLALNYAADGLDVRGYHAVNLGMHLMTALLLFGVVRRTVEREDRNRHAGDAANVALVAALVWALHPLTSEIINYTTQRTTAMMGLFFLTTLYCAIRALDSPHRARWQAFAVAACACGMASKEEMAPAPILVALYDRVFVFPTLGEAFKTRRLLYGGLASTWAVLGGLIWQWPRSTVGLAAVDAWTYASNQAQVIPHYLRLAIWPDQLVLDYGLPARIPAGDVGGGGILLALLLALTIAGLVRWPKPAFLGAAFFMTLAPTSSVVPIASEVGAERRMYLPLAALAVLVVLAARFVLVRARSASPARHQRLLTAAAVIAVVAGAGALATRTMYRNAQYGDSVALWRSSVQYRPHGRARMAYAQALVRAGQSRAAVSELREAVRDYSPAWYALGVELAVEGNSGEAIQALETFIADDPAAANRIPARLLLGRLLFAESQLDESARQFQAVEAADRTNVDAQVSLGDLLMAQQRPSEAALHYRAAVALQPDHQVWLARLGRALDLEGKTEEAADTFRKALVLDPSSRLAHLNLADMWLRRGRPGDAIIHAREAVRLDSRDVAAHNLLGAALAENGQLDEAAAHFQAAVSIDPGNTLARSGLTQVTKLLSARKP
jgi:tetratricopeptide (TPR) repeat protein